MTVKSDEKIVVKVDEDMEDIIPEYLKNRHKDIQQTEISLKKNDFEKIRIIGHSMKGSGGGYGFDRITEIGAVIEQAAINQDSAGVRQQIEQLLDYLNRVEVTYEGEGA